MFAPIRPRPIIPSCMPMPALHPTLLCQCLLDRGVERAQTGGDVRPEMDSEGPAMALRQNLKVPARLRGLDETKRVLLSGDLQILAVLAGHLQEHSAIGTTLVGLAC